MNYFGDELNIIDWLYMNCTAVSSITAIDETIKTVIDWITNPDKRLLWINCSNKKDPPPDFYCPQAHIMMEVMRVDDREFIGNKGNAVNETNARESIIQRELQKLYPEVNHIVVNANSELRGKEDHNYSRYIECIRRVTSKHIKHIDLYRNNHPGYKLVFFIFDESSAYLQTTDRDATQNGVKKGQAYKGKKHCFQLDKAILESFRNVDIDYLLWYAPFKEFCNIDASEQLPDTWFYDLKNMPWDDLIDYPKDFMVSVEE